MKPSRVPARPITTTLGARYARALSNRTLAEAIAARLSGLRIKHLEIDDLGGDGVFRASAVACDARNRVVYAQGAGTIESALEQVLAYLDQAIAGQEP